MRPGKPFMYGRKGKHAGHGPAGQSGFGAGLRQACFSSPCSMRLLGFPPKKRPAQARLAAQR